MGVGATAGYVEGGGRAYGNLPALLSLRVFLRKQVWLGLGLSIPHLKSKSATA